MERPQCSATVRIGDRKGEQCRNRAAQRPDGSYYATCRFHGAGGRSTPGGRPLVHGMSSALDNVADLIGQTSERQHRLMSMYEDLIEQARVALMDLEAVEDSEPCQRCERIKAANTIERTAKLVERGVYAYESVAKSEMHRASTKVAEEKLRWLRVLLNRIRNIVTPQQQWEIAEALQSMPSVTQLLD